MGELKQIKILSLKYLIVRSLSLAYKEVIHFTYYTKVFIEKNTIN
jgi:hypothetical protein